MVLSSHLCLGLPLGLVVKGFHLNIFLAALVSGVLCAWPNQLSLWVFFYIKTFKIASTCFDPKIIFREINCSLLKSHF